MTVTHKIKVLPTEFYDPFLSNLAKDLKPNAINSIYPLEKTPGVISLLAGKPAPQTFPFTSLSFTAKDPTSETAELTITIPQHQLVPGLQYSDTAGIPDFLTWITGLQERAHGRKHGRNGVGVGDEGWRVSVGTGSLDVITKTATLLMSPGDPILVESPVYVGVLASLRNLCSKFIEVPTDAQGIRSSSLREILENWPEGEKRPKVLYTVPYGCNPTGMTASTERKKEVLQLARKYNFLIWEDDPYYYLYYGLSTRPPSYFTLEATEPSGEDAGEIYAEVGRVIRFDSFSKVLSAGMRIGFASGPDPIMRKLDILTGTINIHASSLTQVIAFHLLQSWGYENFFLHTGKISAFYKEKRDIFEREMKKWLGGGAEGDHEGRLAEWVPPEAGLFFWFKLIIDPAAQEEEDSRELIETHAFANGVIALPGVAFIPNGSKTAYVRASFSLVEEEEAAEAMKRLRKTVLDARKASKEVKPVV